MYRRTWLGLSILAVALVPLAWGRQPPDPKDKPSPVGRAAAATRQLTADLRDAQDLLKTIPDRRTRERLELILSRAELRANDIQKELAALAAASKPVPVPEADFARILMGLKGQSFDKDRMPLIENLGPSRHFTSAQVRALLKEFSFDDGRAKAAIALYPQVLDPEKFATALEAFTFDANRKAVREKLNLK